MITLLKHGNQRRCGLKRSGGSCNFPTDSCKFPREGDTSAQHFNFAPTGDFQLQIRGRKYSDNILPSPPPRRYWWEEEYLQWMLNSMHKWRALDTSSVWMQTTADVGAECRHDMRPSVTGQMPSLTSADSKLGLVRSRCLSCSVLELPPSSKHALNVLILSSVLTFCDPDPVFEKTCEATQKNVKSHVFFWILKKKRKNVPLGLLNL